LVSKAIGSNNPRGADNQQERLKRCLV
jgi:hypothetical protein